MQSFSLHDLNTEVQYSNYLIVTVFYSNPALWGDNSILLWKPEVTVDFSRMFEASEHHIHKQDQRFKSFRRESPTFLTCAVL